MGKALVKSQEGVVAGQRQLACRGLDRPDDTVKQPRGFRIEPVEGQPGARQIALADPVAQERGLAVAGRGRDEGQAVRIGGRGQGVFQTRTLQRSEAAHRLAGS